MNHPLANERKRAGSCRGRVYILIRQFEAEQVIYILYDRLQA
jgi:hypothetical protein